MRWVTSLFLFLAWISTVLTCEVSFIVETSRTLNSTDSLLLSKSVDSLSQCTRFCSSVQNCTHFTFSAAENAAFNCQLFSETNPISPVLTAAGAVTVGTKTCLENKCLKRSFAFEKFGGKSLLNSSYIIKTFSIGLTECLSQCQKESSCRGALYNRVTSLCQLSKISLNSVYNPRMFFKSSNSIDLFENTCIDFTMSTSACTFMRVTGGGLKTVSDQVIQRVGGTEECEQMCVVRTRVADPCRSYTYDNSTMECHLMWSSARLLGRSPLENMKKNLFHGDLDDCVNFSLKCRETNLEVKANSLRMFVGRMMTKKSKKILCEEDYEGEYEFSSKFDFKKCGLEPTKTKDSTYRGMVHVKEGSTSLVTIRDKVLQVNCRMHKSIPSEEQSLSVHMNVRENNKTDQVMSDDVVVTSTTSSAGNPKFSLKILGLDSTEADSVHIGDFGWIMLNVRDAAEDFTVTNLVARDVISGRVLRIIDEDGCVVRRDIVKEIRKTDNYVKLKISFSGFRRQTEVVYHAMVETCTVGCMPKCNQDMMLPEEDTNVRSTPLSLDLPRHRMVRRSIAGEPRQLLLTSDVYKVHGHKLTLLNPEKTTDFLTPSQQSNYDFNEFGEYHDGDVVVVKHTTGMLTSVKHCLVDDITCLLTVILGAIQMFLMFSCILIMYCYYQQWRYYRELNRRPDEAVQYFRSASPKPQVTNQQT